MNGVILHDHTWNRTLLDPYQVAPPARTPENNRQQRAQQRQGRPMAPCDQQDPSTDYPRHHTKCHTDTKAISMPPNDPTSSSTLTQTSRINRKTTANKPLLSTSKSIEDHATEKRSIHTALNLPTAGNILLAISTALFEFSASANLGATHTDIIRAFAFITHEVQKNINAEEIIEKVGALMGGPVATLDEKVEAFEEVLEKYKSEMEKVITEVRTNFQTSTEELVKAAKSASTSVPQSGQTTDTTSGSNGPRSYAEAAKTNPSPILTKVLARSEDLTEAQLVAKAALAIELLTKDNEDTPTNLAFLSARRLPHGGVLYELDSVESVLWFNVPAHRSKFLEHFSTEIVIKDRSFHILVENVPISFIPDNHATIADVERRQASNISQYTEQDISNRQPGATQEGANQAIKHGLSIEGKKVYGRKLIQEPTRNTTLAERVATNTERPPAQSLIRPNTGARTAIVAGHAAWSRDCPMFISKWESYKNRNVDAKYRFFLTEDPLTWETLNNPPQPRENTENWNQHRDHHQNVQPQSHHRFPPPEDRTRGFQTVHHQRQPPQEHHARNTNRVPLGNQTRIPESWLSQPRPPQHPPPPRENERPSQQ
ncbi:hypothetical protein DFJ58DRAFT_750333 [Suillus subalutaceus]|uniref:uncharacterized protein n=1 Tax=Suillus subalutaceus TaxID=48586 RepID=UPI001B87BA07|nr:uncharacterized protein DFJ58DRAFT_750333 [Suillus subalutaceus]KAG1832875.1 hypothetical protein DFJ58DRAFT_750333 [Suillus subalutaceus]